MKKYGFVFLLSIGLSLPTSGKSCLDKNEFESGKEKVHLIELYTSEGCSSCPPSEAWLNSLKDHENLYQSFIPIAFHVDYWNYLGHPDPLSKASFSQRQREYASEWQSRSVYTPGFVKDGEEWRSLLRKPPLSKGKVVGNLKVKIVDKLSYEVNFVDGKAEVLYGALLTHGIENKIKRGENRGKTLRHNFVVTNLKKIRLKDNKGKIQFEGLKGDQKEQSIVFWVTSSSSKAPIQSVGQCLSL